MIGRIALAGALIVPPSAQAADIWAGRAIFQEGVGVPNIFAMLPGSTMPAPATAFACAGCHGAAGQGARDAGITPPPLAAVAAVARDQARFYAFLNGERRASAPSIMPRYRMTHLQSDALAAYIQRLDAGDAAEPGVSAHRIRIGTVLPLSGPAAALGATIAARLRETIDDANRSGGVYGRSIELVVADGALDPGRALEQLRHSDLFALVATMTADRALLDAAGAIPIVVPLAVPGPNEASSIIRIGPPVGGIATSPSERLTAQAEAASRLLLEALRQCGYRLTRPDFIGAARARATPV